MNRALLVLAAAVVAALAFHHPAAPPTVTSAVAAPRRMAAVRKTAPPQLVVYVAGASRIPGTSSRGWFANRGCDRPRGRLRAGGDPASVNLAAPLSDGDEVVALKSVTARSTRVRNRAPSLAERPQKESERHG